MNQISLSLTFFQTLNSLLLTQAPTFVRPNERDQWGMSQETTPNYKPNSIGLGNAKEREHHKSPEDKKQESKGDSCPVNNSKNGCFNPKKTNKSRAYLQNGDCPSTPGDLQARNKAKPFKPYNMIAFQCQNIPSSQEEKNTRNNRDF